MGLPPRFGRVEKLRHVNLIKNYNVGNVYTDNQVYNKPSFWFNLNEVGNIVVTSLLKILTLDPSGQINLLTSYIVLTNHGFQVFLFRVSPHCPEEQLPDVQAPSHGHPDQFWKRRKAGSSRDRPDSVFVALHAARSSPVTFVFSSAVSAVVNSNNCCQFQILFKVKFYL